MSQTFRPLFDVCVVGLGYVGLTVAAVFADEGAVVVGVDSDPSLVAVLASGRTTFDEPGLGETIAAVVREGRLTTVSANDPLPAAGAYIIAVGTPIEDGRVVLADLERAVETVGESMPAGSLIVIRSTVPVGTTRAMHGLVQRIRGVDVAMAMAPERTIEGRALAELREIPQIIGGIDAAASETAQRLFGRIGAEPVLVRSPEAAELSKLALNTQRDLEFAFANELAYFAYAAGVDVLDVIRASNYRYKRGQLRRPGPVGGPCLEKDAVLLQHSGQLVGTTMGLSATARVTNEDMARHVARIVHDTVHARPSSIGIAGTAFKGRPAVGDTRGSMATRLVTALRSLWPDVEIVGNDVEADDAASAATGVDVVSQREMMSRACVLIVQTNHEHYSSTEFLGDCQFLPTGATIVDLWDQVPPEVPRRDDVRVISLGRHEARR